MAITRDSSGNIIGNPPVSKEPTADPAGVLEDFTSWTDTKKFNYIVELLRDLSLEQKLKLFGYLWAVILGVP